MAGSMSVSVGVHITLFRDPCAFCRMWLYDYPGIILLAEEKQERKIRVTSSCAHTHHFPSDSIRELSGCPFLFGCSREMRFSCAPKEKSRWVWLTSAQSAVLSLLLKNESGKNF